jgi:hypothetical protein
MKPYEKLRERPSPAGNISVLEVPDENHVLHMLWKGGGVVEFDEMEGVS